jgi:hypothetical protein
MCHSPQLATDARNSRIHVHHDQALAEYAILFAPSSPDHLTVNDDREHRFVASGGYIPRRTRADLRRAHFRQELVFSGYLRECAGEGAVYRRQKND